MVLGPPLNNSGGVGTLFTYFKEVAKDEVDLTFIDTRGPYKRAIFSVFNLLSALVKVTYLRLTGQIDLAHLNMGSKGSTFRKLILTWWIKAALRKPIVIQLHASGFDTWMQTLGAKTKSLVVRTLNRSDQTLVLGEFWRRKLLDLGVKEDRVRILVMGVPHLNRERTVTGKVSPVVKVLFAGEMSERKGLPNLLEALGSESLAHFELCVAGSGDQEHWRKYAQTLGISNKVSFLGLVPLWKIKELLLTTDVLVLPSRAEGLPVSVMEGLSAGVAVVCTSVGALDEYLVDGRNSVILKSPSVQDIISGLKLTENAQLRSLLGQEGYRTWRENFDVNLTYLKLLSVWKEISGF